jgi:hypothetical protein
VKIYKSNPVKKTMTIKVSKDNPLAVDGNPLEDLRFWVQARVGLTPSRGVRVIPESSSS